MEYILGKTYEVNHSRKGKFSIEILSQNDEWLTGIIKKGMAGAMLDYNEKGEGEKITIRKSLINSANVI